MSSGQAAPPREARSILKIRIVLAGVTSIAVCAGVWATASRSLAAPLEIVGYPAFADYNFPRVFLAYRLVVWVFPVLATATFYALGRIGPLAGHARPARVPVPFADDQVHVPEVSRLGRVPRLLPVMAVVGIAGSSGPMVTNTHLNFRGLVPAIAYAVIALLCARYLTHRSHGLAWPDALSRVNLFAGSIATIAAGAYFVSRTAVLRGARVDHWNWWPLWFPVVAVVALTALLVVLVRRGRDVELLEWRLLTVLVGSTAVFLLTTALPGAPAPLLGFDDMMSVTGADLLGRGYFPWRDFIFIHGIFEDALRSSAGFALFEHTFWGAQAATAALWVPCCWVSIYLFGVWVAPRRWVLHITLVLLSAYWVLQGYQAPRWVVAALVLALLGQAIRSTGAWWTVLFTVVLFVEAVLVPEASYQVVASLLVLVLSDLVHRPRGVTQWRALRRTRIFVLTGTALSIVWAGALLSQGALGPFVEYYAVFGPGHAASGALPLDRGGTEWQYVAAFLAIVFIVVTSLWVGLVCLLSRRTMTPSRWVGVAAALLAALYTEKALGRFDSGHIVQVAYVALPMVVVWFAWFTGVLDDRLRELLAHRRHSRIDMSWLRYPASFGLVLILVITVPTIGERIWTSSRNNKVVVAGSRAPLVGYTNPLTLNRPLLNDLRSITDALAGPSSPVFDFSNSPGYFYYLLQRSLPTPYYHVSMAIPAFAQEAVIDDLKRTKPPVVVFDSEGVFGLSAWDGISNDIRHFLIAQYLLDGWTPVVRASGVLFLVRNDLLGTVGPLPRTRLPIQTTDLYTSAGGCNWGAVPNFLPAPAEAPSRLLRSGAPTSVRQVAVTGWAYDVARRESAVTMVAAVGDTIVQSSFGLGQSTVTEKRPGVPSDASADFATSFTTTKAGSVDYYAVLSDGAAHPLGTTARRPLPSALVEADGTRLGVRPRSVAGAVTRSDSRAGTLSDFTVPSSIDLSAYQRAALSTDSNDIGTADLELTDGSPDATTANRNISLSTLPMVGRHVSVRVGSCLEWHGFGGRHLYLTQFGGRRITTVLLSDARD